MIIDKPSVPGLFVTVLFLHGAESPFGRMYVSIYINFACLSWWMSICLFISNKRQNG